MTLGGLPDDQHEVAENLPLLSDAARVTDVEALDHNRRTEILDVLRSPLTERGWTDVLDGGAVDWDTLRDRIDCTGVRESFRRRLDALRDRFERAVPSLVRIRLHTSEEFEFVPGEYVTVSYDGTPRVYSIASSPNRDYLELCIRRVPGGRLSTSLCDECAPGERVPVRGPYGDEFVLQDVSGRDMVFLATGTGVAPFKSMIEYTFEEGRDRYRGEKRDVWLVLGAAWEDDLPYRERFRELDAAHENFHFVPTLSRESHLGSWDGETEYVQRTLLKYLEDGVLDGVDDLSAPAAGPATDVEARLDPSNLEVYACGFDAMVYDFAETAHAMGVPDDLIRMEGYG